MNKYLTVKVYTQRGLIKLKDILPGDSVIEYATGKLLKVIKVNHVVGDETYKVTYSDGRTQYYLKRDNVYTGDRIISVKSLKKLDQLPEIKLYPVELYSNDVSKPLDPDAYIAGALLMYGDYDDKYINLPMNMTGVNSVLENKYNLKYNDEINKSGNAHFHYKGTYKWQTITWNNFFNEKIYITDRLIKIPSLYSLSRLKDRIQFIRGVFDAGYSERVFPYTVGITNKSVIRLSEFQKILWSVGILSKIDLDKNIQNGDQFKLEVIGDYGGYPGFCYVLDNIERCIDNDKHIISYNPQDSVKIVNVELLKNKHDYMEHIRLEKPKALYMTENYLPRVSM